MSRITQAIHHHPTAAYFVMVYSSAWAVWITVGILTNEIPLGAVLVGAWTPSVSAVILTGYLTGRSGMRLLLRRILLWRVGIRWYLFVLFSAAIIGLTAILLFISLGGSPSRPSGPPGVPRELGYILLPIVFFDQHLHWRPTRSIDLAFNSFHFMSIPALLLGMKLINGWFCASPDEEAWKYERTNSNLVGKFVNCTGSVSRSHS
jgi:hypothetical protein